MKSDEDMEDAEGLVATQARQASGELEARGPGRRGAPRGSGGWARRHVPQGSSRVVKRRRRSSSRATMMRVWRGRQRTKDDDGLWAVRVSEPKLVVSVRATGSYWC